ncbi:AAA family ATPase [Alteromonas halophila]|uniref:ATPase AAA-type core domain-containing protein n=1 Tax=Alteromonas halophila TaxID=516698 RepID=A0A918JQK2_9ALTE|nr:ATP-binding protein [Alteromonas halophila]GGW97921.1 hypothetical protein GCM10007391_34930 [Alteromonas halophila]
MIVDFTVENFRSIKSSQLFSMFAEHKPKHHSNNIHFLEPGFGVLRTAAIYGSNAAGKTNLLLAFDTLKDIVVESEGWKEGDDIEQYQPYLLSNSCKNSDTTFDIEFIVKNNRYRYEVRFNKTEITYEKLEVYKTAKPSTLFHRESIGEEHSLKIGETFRGGKRTFAFFKNNSYLSIAGSSPESPKFIRDIYKYFYRGLLILENGTDFTVNDWENIEEVKGFVNSFLSKADFGIDSFDVKKKSLHEGFHLPQEMPESLKKKIIGRFTKDIVFYHKNESGELVEFPESLESHGTKSILKLIPFIAMVLLTGRTLIIDEIETSLHPHIAELVIKLFNDPNVNIRGAQLIYTTHDVSLMAQDKLRKDQIYLVHKCQNEGTEFRSLDNFDSELRDNSPFSKWYHEGRLGGIPEIHYKDIAASIIGAIENA